MISNKTRINEFLAHDVLKNTNEDEYCIAGKRLGYQLKELEDQQRFIAEKLISDVMFYARMGKLTENSAVHCNNVSSLQVPISRSQIIHQQPQQYEYLLPPSVMASQGYAGARCQPQAVSRTVDQSVSHSTGDLNSNITEYFHTYQAQD